MEALIALRGVSKRYATPAGEFTALSGIDLEIGKAASSSPCGASPARASPRCST